jgi:DNA-binding NtrC family response regulator
MPHSGSKVLLVDDDGGWLGLLTDVLESEGYTVAQAENGVDALRLLSAFAASVIVTDLQMPEMSGEELLAQLVARDKTIPVIVITGEPERGADKDLTEAFRVLSKPVSVDRLLSALADASAH